MKKQITPLKNVTHFKHLQIDTAFSPQNTHKSAQSVSSLMKIMESITIKQLTPTKTLNCIPHTLPLLLAHLGKGWLILSKITAYPYHKISYFLFSITTRTLKLKHKQTIRILIQSPSLKNPHHKNQFVKIHLRAENLIPLNLWQSLLHQLILATM